VVSNPFAPEMTHLTLALLASAGTALFEFADLS
jgi:hypothetical protein